MLVKHESCVCEGLQSAALFLLLVIEQGLALLGMSIVVVGMYKGPQPLFI